MDDKITDGIMSELLKKKRGVEKRTALLQSVSVAQRRRHAPVNKFMSFAGRNTKFLTISRVILMMYCEDEEITVGSVTEQADQFEISRSTVHRYFVDAVDEGVFTKTGKGVYEYTPDALEHQLENLHRLLLNENTHRLYTMLHSFYSLLDTALLQNDDEKIRRAKPSRMNKMLKLVDDDVDKDNEKK